MSKTASVKLTEEEYFQVLVGVASRISFLKEVGKDEEAEVLERARSKLRKAAAKTL